MKIPDYCEAVVGYRVWRVTPGGLLTGVHVMEPWAPKQAHRATCQKKFDPSGAYWAQQSNETRHLDNGEYVPAPALACSCGLWAVKSPDRMWSACVTPDLFETGGFAWGEVWLWGRVIEHETGWRAECAYPKTLKATSEAAAVATRYGIPCEAVSPAQPATPPYDPYEALYKQMQAQAQQQYLRQWQRLQQYAQKPPTRTTPRFSDYLKGSW